MLIIFQIGVDVVALFVIDIILLQFNLNALLRVDLITLTQVYFEEIFFKFLLCI